MEKLKRFTLDLTQEEHIWLKVAAAKLGITMREFTQNAIQEALYAANQEFEKRDVANETANEQLKGEFILSS